MSEPITWVRTRRGKWHILRSTAYVRPYTRCFRLPPRANGKEAWANTTSGAVNLDDCCTRCLESAP